MKIELVAMSDLNHGDTVLVNGVMTTVSAKNDFKNCPFMGTTLFGMRFENVERVLFPTYLEGQFNGYVARR